MLTPASLRRLHTLTRGLHGQVLVRGVKSRRLRKQGWSPASDPCLPPKSPSRRRICSRRFRRFCPSQPIAPNPSWSPCRRGRIPGNSLPTQRRRRATPRGTGAPKPGSGNANASFAQPKIGAASPRGAAPALNCFSRIAEGIALCGSIWPWRYWLCFRSSQARLLRRGTPPSHRIDLRANLLLRRRLARKQRQQFRFVDHWNLELARFIQFRSGLVARHHVAGFFAH